MENSRRAAGRLPPYVINSGGVLHGAGLESLGWSEEQVEERLRGIGDLLVQLYADDDGSPVHAADRLVESRLSAAYSPGTAR